ncbi:DnaN DNA polymerase sliding clamp subunit (PCNA homolog) [uncultured Caudovirales phage]|uniref:DnaN DNA polymerase sliding clamp subunit (PCNA homolog) n=1 Tax=uncultured Caudovirales phage TaxID=2100421 RepID=A0A6J5MB86_9CAUD|nr:DnaN DNA polymerase sliding clamp subunit (PCNA homolog) [uncultured Caudovirales phage]
MKTEINRKNIIEALKTSKTFGADAIRISGNQFIAVAGRNTLEIEIDAHGAIDVTIDAYTLKDLQKAIGAKKTAFVEIADNGNGTATIDGMIRLKTINEKIEMKFVDGSAELYELKTAQLLDAIRGTLPFVSDNETAPILCGINMRTHGRRLTFESTNRHYAGQYTIETATLAIKDESSTFDTNAMKAVATLKTDAENVRIFRGEKRTSFVFGADTATISIAHMDGVYPDFTKIYLNAHSSNLSNIVFNRSELLDTLKLHTKTTDDKKSFITKLNYTHADEIATITDKEENFNARLKVRTNALNKDYSIAFNGKYMLNAVQAVEYDSVYMNVDEKSAMNPILIMDVRKHGETFEILILPYKVQS